MYLYTLTFFRTVFTRRELICARDSELVTHVPDQIVLFHLQGVFGLGVLFVCF